MGATDFKYLRLKNSNNSNRNSNESTSSIIYTINYPGGLTKEYSDEQSWLEANNAMNNWVNMYNELMNYQPTIATKATIPENLPIQQKKDNPNFWERVKNAIEQFASNVGNQAGNAFIPYQSQNIRHNTQRASGVVTEESDGSYTVPTKAQQTQAQHEANMALPIIGTTLTVAALPSLVGTTAGNLIGLGAAGVGTHELANQVYNNILSEKGDYTQNIANSINDYFGIENPYGRGGIEFATNLLDPAYYFGPSLFTKGVGVIERGISSIGDNLSYNIPFLRNRTLSNVMNENMGYPITEQLTPYQLWQDQWGTSWSPTTTSIPVDYNKATIAMYNRPFIEAYNKWNTFGYPSVPKGMEYDTEALEAFVKGQLNRHNTYARGVQVLDFEKQALEKSLGRTLTDDEFLRISATTPRSDGTGQASLWISPYTNLASIYGGGQAALIRRPYKLGNDRMKWFDEASFKIEHNPGGKEYTEIMAPWNSKPKLGWHGRPLGVINSGSETELVSPYKMEFVDFIKGSDHMDYRTSLNSSPFFTKEGNYFDPVTKQWIINTYKKGGQLI